MIATSPLETIAVNRHLGLHTLVLLDLIRRARVPATNVQCALKTPMQACT